MHAEAMSLSFLSNEGLVKIPFFQRGYVWNINNWEDILTDLLDTGKNHFLGSLILKQIGSQTGKSKEVLVIDGQQRLTTLSILLRVLYNSFDNETQENCKSSIEVNLFYKKYATDNEYLVKIEHSKIDKKYFQKIIKNEISKQELDSIVIENFSAKTKSKDNNVLQCFKYFTIKINELTIDKRKDLFNRLLDKDNKILVIIDLLERDDEQAIFDTINSAGVRLSSADIIKNALFQKALEVYGNEEDVEVLYREYWECVFANDEETIIFWDTPRATGRLMRDNIEILLHSISVIKGFFDPDKHTLSDLSNLYKEYINKIEKPNLEKFIREISDYAKLFREKILVFSNSSLFCYNDFHSRLFHILSVCEISTFHPYILYLFYNFKDDENTLKDELQKIESLVIKRMISRTETKSYNKLCKDFINKNDNIKQALDKISNDEILSGLSNIANKYAALILFWVELYRRNKNSKYDLKELKYNYSLEHIMPQKWEEFWSDVNIVDEEGNIISDKEVAKQYRHQKIYSIGNMTLLNSSLNSSVRNYEISRKIEGDGRKKGIRHYAELGITRVDILDKYDSGDKIWDEKKISERTKQLYEDFLLIW